jgi:hypothetical protein
MAGLSLIVGAGALTTILLVPPVREKFFTTKLWPWPLPFDTTAEELATLKSLSKPGDIVVESNLHGFQWIALSLLTTQTSWVHASLVDDRNRLLTVEKEVIETDFDIFLRWGSTRLGLIRPNYGSEKQVQDALAFARSHIGRRYDASFQDTVGNCSGLVASSLRHAGLSVPQKRVLGRDIYAPDCFFQIPDAKVVWLRKTHRRG